MKIGIACYPSVGGSGVVATELGHQLALKGHEVHFITYAIPFRLRLQEENVHFHEVEVNRYDLFEYPDYALTLAVKMAQVARDHDLDILHAHYAIPHATSAFLAREMIGSRKPRLITTLHGTDITLIGREPAFHPIVQLSLQKSDQVTAVSQSLKEETLDHFDCPIQVIPNFFVPQKVPDIRNQFVSGEEKLIVHASNFRPVKRIPDVLEIFNQIRASMAAKLLLIGDGPELQMTEDTIHIGSVQEIDPYLKAADLNLLPSDRESFGMVALEAMAYGTPTVGTLAGGLPELIEDGISGILEGVGERAKMSQRAIALLQDQAAYQAMAQAAVARSKAFSAEKVVSQYEELYRK